MRDYIMDAAVSLRRNYADLPFDALRNEETARRVSERAVVALERSGDTYAYLLTAQISPEKMEALQQKRLLSIDAKEADYGASYLRMDEKLCVETAGEDHLRISAYDESGDVLQCLKSCQAAESSLENTGRIAHNDTFGFLTTCPCDMGTGLRASLLLHLPMTAITKKTSQAMKIAAGAGMVLRNLTNGMCLLENRVTMGAEETALIQRLEETARRLCELEGSLRGQALEKHDMTLIDQVWRAYALARYARRMTQAETLRIWSALTLGLTLDEVPYTETMLEGLWQVAHLPQGALNEEKTMHPDVVRAKRVRSLFDGGN